MNYHIMVQDKFLDAYIEDIFEIKEENNNVFLFRGNRGVDSYVKTEREVEFIDHDKKSWIERLQKLGPDDNIFVHWYDNWIAEVVYNLPNKLFVIYWGGEFFQEPYWYHADWVFDKKTLEFVKKIKWPHFSLNPQKLKRYIYNKLIYPSVLRSEYLLKDKFVSRIDYLVIGESNNADLTKIKELYPSFKAKNISGSYDLNFDLADQINKESEHIRSNNKLKILLGNSATEANNHLDALDVLRNLNNIEIYCPLSYGNKQYRDHIINYGKKLFGDDFHPVLDFMKRDEYVAYLKSMDVVYMFHNRSQAWGNIATCLSLGKPVFMKKQNSLTVYIESLGICIYDVYDIYKMDLKELILQNKDRLNYNKEKLSKEISKKKRLEELSFLMKI